MLYLIKWGCLQLSTWSAVWITGKAKSPQKTSDTDRSLCKIFSFSLLSFCSSCLSPNWKVGLEWLSYVLPVLLIYFFFSLSPVYNPQFSFFSLEMRWLTPYALSGCTCAICLWHCIGSSLVQAPFFLYCCWHSVCPLTVANYWSYVCREKWKKSECLFWGSSSNFVSITVFLQFEVLGWLFFSPSIYFACLDTEYLRDCFVHVCGQLSSGYLLASANITAPRSLDSAETCKDPS